MDDPGSQLPDWNSVFSQARRRVFGRVLLVAAIGAVGALVLFSSGAAVHWKVVRQPSDRQSPTANEKQKKKHTRRKTSKKHHEREHGHGGQGGKGKNGNGKPTPKPHPHPCTGDAVKVEYCETLKEATSSGESTTSGGEPTTSTSNGEPIAESGSANR